MKDQYYKKAISYLNRAIEIEEKPNYLCDRAQAYAKIHQSEKAVEDFKRANDLHKQHPDSSILQNAHIKYLLKDLATIDAIQKTIKQQRQKGILPKDFLDAFDNLTNVTSKLCVKVTEHDHQIKGLKSQLDKLSQKTKEIYAQILEGKATQEAIIVGQQEIKEATGLMLKIEIEKMRNDEPKLYTYCSTFKWIIFNMFESYRILRSLYQS